MYMGQEGLYTAVFQYTRRADCAACARPTLALVLPRDTTLGAVVEELKTRATLQLSNPSLAAVGRSLYYARGPLHAVTVPNLDKSLGELFPDASPAGEVEVSVTDDVFPSDVALALTIRFTD